MYSIKCFIVRTALLIVSTRAGLFMVAGTRADGFQGLFCRYFAIRICARTYN